MYGLGVDELMGTSVTLDVMIFIGRADFTFAKDASKVGSFAKYLRRYLKSG